MSMTNELLAEVVSSLERLELPLLRWGIVDGAISRKELDRVLKKFDDQAPAGQIEEALFERLLLFEIPPQGSGLYRTRMSESLRLFRHLRQTLRSDRSEEGSELVADFRIIHRHRQRPRRDIPSTEYLEDVKDFFSKSTVTQLSKITPPTVSAFQIRSMESVCSALQRSSDSGVMISAGTGAGKTFAFYGPALASIIASVESNTSAGVRLLSIYPRGELLKDQFNNLLEWVVKMGASANGRPIRIGAWFGPTPKIAAFVNDRNTSWRKHRDGYICPFAKCFGEDCDGDLVWRTADIAASQERLFCSRECGVEIGEEFITLTRSRAETSPPDVMLTTTESLNRQLADLKNRSAFGLVGPSLSMVLIDEIHTYEGTSGAQSAVLMRRLRSCLPSSSRIL